MPVRLASSGCFQDQLLCASPTLTVAPRAPSVSQALSQLLTLPRPYSVMAPTRSPPRHARSHSDIQLRGCHEARTVATTVKTVPVSQKVHALKKTGPSVGCWNPDEVHLVECPGLLKGTSEPPMFPLSPDPNWL